ncbi:C39 family peptidase [Marinicrinis sediminis]|uniref:C39 family peptidase n=1 Tax=Marinicrinis sediminis TaxID=1652465 RepID=A0ABW5R701_9BACL
MNTRIFLPKFSKVYLSIFLALTLALPTSVYGVGSGDNPSLINDIPTEKQQKALQEKMQLVKQYEKERKTQFSNDNKLNTLSSSVKTLSVPSFEQETYYWCGPATVKQVLDSINGSSNSQSYYANELGTTTSGTVFSLVDDILNDHQTDTTYVYTDFQSNEYNTWESIMMAAVDLFYVPAVLDLKITPSNMPLYTSNVAGHILNNSGYDISDSNNKKIRLTDPFDQGGRGVTIGNVWHPMEGVWNANQAHFRKAVIY